MRRLFRWIARRRSALLELAGFGFLVAAAFQVGLVWGLLAAGLACLNFALDPLGGRRR